MLTPLLDLLAWEGALDATAAISTRLAERFDYVTDVERLGEPDSWPTRAEVIANLEAHGGRLVGDCDDYAFAAAYALHDLGVAARVVVGACAACSPTTGSEFSP